MLTRYRSAWGFTLIEMMISIAVLGILIGLSTPVYNTWIANTQIRNQAESIQNGLRLAQTEAAKRNAQVDFVLTADDLSADPTDASPTASTTGTSWVVRVAGATPTFIQGKSSREGSPDTSLACQGTCPTGFDGTVSFTGLGRTTLAGALQMNVTSAQSGTRTLRVVVTTGGKVRMCDPAYSAGDPRACS